MRADDWIKQATEQLKRTGIDSPRLEAQVLAAHALERDRAWMLAHPEAVVPGAAKAALERRLAREPLAYILGTREFYGRKFRVNPAVLIPRQETETLISAALEILRDHPAVRVLDVGTGSGCLAITLKLERPAWEVWALDISEGALEIARTNATALGAEVETLQSDLFQALPNGKRFDLIVTNPPYIRDGEKLMPEVSDHEPRAALYAGSTGLEVFERLSVEASEFLSKDATLVVEVGDGQASRVRATFKKGWHEVAAFRDLSGHERALALRPRT